VAWTRAPRIGTWDADNKIMPTGEMRSCAYVAARTMDSNHGTCLLVYECRTRLQIRLVVSQTGLTGSQCGPFELLYRKFRVDKRPHFNMIDWKDLGGVGLWSGWASPH